jgi:hypothetical protein
LSSRKKLEAKNPKYYSVGINTQTPFAVPEQSENKNLEDPVQSDFQRMAIPRMSYRSKPQDFVGEGDKKFKRGSKKQQKKKASRF